MPDMGALFPMGWGLKRVNPQAQNIMAAAAGDISSVGPACTTWSAKGLVTAAAGTWQTVLDVTGAGYFDGAALSNTSATAVYVVSGLRITIDGTVFTCVSEAGVSSASNLWSTPCDLTYDSGASSRRLAFKPLHIPYGTSLKVEVLRGNANSYAWAVWHAPEF